MMKVYKRKRDTLDCGSGAALMNFVDQDSRKKTVAQGGLASQCPDGTLDWYVCSFL
jgi:hypothetical protein